MSTINIFPETEEEARVIFSKKNFKKNGYTNGELDNFEDWEKEYYTDEDEVFMAGLNTDAASQTKPLMHPRQRTKVKSRNPDCRCRKILKPILCFLLLVLTLGSLMLLILYVYNKYSVHNLNIFQNKPKSKQSKIEDVTKIIGCDNIEVDDVWVVGFPKLLTESAIRLVDVNKDGVIDVIIGFGTGADGYYIPNIVCDIYFNGTYPCFGGLLALDGLSGKEIWRHYSSHELFGINCNADLNKDGVLDCLGGGRAGAFDAVSGKDGSLLWTFEAQEAKNDIMNLYTAHIIRDLDGDGVVDILAIHGGDPLQEPGSKFRLSGRLIFFSGRTGEVLKWLGVPDEKESYYSPQIYDVGDGTEIVLFGTGGETHGGSLWSITLDDLYKGNINNAHKIYEDKFKGVMTPPVLLDLTGDGVADIVMSMFNSTVMAIDGATYKQIWKHDFPVSESYNTPSPGYYNNDTTPDFMVKYAHGPGFPLYYYSETTILDGKTGKPLVNPSVKDAIGAQASPLTISVEGYGNDIFLYWVADCQNHEGEGGTYKFVEGTNVHEQSRSDFCHLRFKSEGFSKIYALSSNINQPGVAVYYSDERKQVEHDSWINTTAEAEKYLYKHPELYKDFVEYRQQETKSESDKPFNKFKNVDTARQKQNEEEFSYNLPFENQHPQVSSKKGQFLPYQTSQSTIQLKPQYHRQRQKDIQLPISEGGTYGYPGYDTDVENILENAIQDDYKNRYDNSYGSGYGSRSNGNSYGNDYGSRSNGMPYGTLSSSGYPDYGEFGKYYQRRKPSVTHTLPPVLGRKRPHMRQKRSINWDYILDTKQLRDYSKLDKKELKNIANLQSLQKSLNEEMTRRRSFPKDEKQRKRNRKRRHVGPHDEEGLQRLLSTGTIAPTTLPPDHPHYNHTIDLIFATYWFFPAKTQAILPEDEECISQKLSQEKIRFSPTSKYYGLDHDGYEHVITQECLKESDHGVPDEGTYESQTSYNPYNVHMGQLTVYRVRIKCTCKNTSATKDDNTKCSRILPFDQQQWTGYMGNNADSHWKPKDTDENKT